MDIGYGHLSKCYCDPSSHLLRFWYGNKKKNFGVLAQVRTLSISYLQFIQLCYKLLGTFTEEYDLLSEYFTQKINLFAFWSLHLTENHAFLSQLVKIGRWHAVMYCKLNLFKHCLKNKYKKSIQAWVLCFWPAAGAGCEVLTDIASSMKLRNKLSHLMITLKVHKRDIF